MKRDVGAQVGFLLDLEERINLLLEGNRTLQHGHLSEIKQVNFDMKGKIAYQRKLRIEIEKKLSELINDISYDTSTETDSCPPSEDDN